MFNFGLFVKLYLKSLFAYHEVNARFSLRHVLFLILFPPAFLLLELGHRIGFLLDAICFSGFRTIEVKSPVFIVGFPRSGTTYLHRLINQDDQFTSMKLWEILFAPSIVQKKFFLLLGRIDRRIGNPFYRAVCAFEDRVYAEARKMHPVSHFEAEEDELVLIHIFSSAFLSFMFPFEEMQRFAHFDTRINPGEKKRIMGFYKNCIRRHLYVFGRNRHYVSKNPAFSSKVHAIYDTFPDARVICMVRNPLEAVPSAISWMSYNFRSFHDLKAAYETERIMDWISHWYSYPVVHLKNYPEASRAVETYDALMAGPKALLEKLYSRFGFEMTGAFETLLDEAQQRASKYESRHEYRIEQMGLTREGLLSQFSKIVEEFGFSSKPA